MALQAGDVKIGDLISTTGSYYESHCGIFKVVELTDEPRRGPRIEAVRIMKRDGTLVMKSKIRQVFGYSGVSLCGPDQINEIFQQDIKKAEDKARHLSSHL